MTRIDLQTNLQIIQLTNAIDALLAQYPELESDEVLRADTFAGATTIEEVLSQLVAMAEEAGNIVIALDIRLEKTRQRRDRYKKQYDAIRSLITTIMERADLKKITIPEATISVRYKQPSPIVVDETILPDQYTRVVRSPNLTAIKELDGRTPDGKMIPGVSLSNGCSVLTIRTV